MTELIYITLLLLLGFFESVLSNNVCRLSFCPVVVNTIFQFLQFGTNKDELVRCWKMKWCSDDINIPKFNVTASSWCSAETRLCSLFRIMTQEQKVFLHRVRPDHLAGPLTGPLWWWRRSLREQGGVRRRSQWCFWRTEFWIHWSLFVFYKVYIYDTSLDRRDVA